MERPRDRRKKSLSHIWCVRARAWPSEKILFPYMERPRDRRKKSLSHIWRVHARATVGKIPFPIYGAFAHACCHRPTDRKKSSEKILGQNHRAHACCHRLTDRKKSSEKILGRYMERLRMRVVTGRPIGKNPRKKSSDACVLPQADRSDKILFPIYGMFAHALCRISRTKSSPPSASVCLGVPRCASRGTLFCASRGTRDRTKSLFPSLDVLKPNLMVCWRKSH